jgi:uncharacterized membrane protein (UPF0127 family)
MVVVAACKALPMSWLVTGGRVLASAEVARTHRAKAKGLVGRDGLEGAFVIPGCRWVHALGMRFPIDVAYLDVDGVVLKTVRLARYRVGAPVRHARTVVEASAGAFERWGLHVGDVVELRDSDAAGDTDSRHGARPDERRATG